MSDGATAGDLTLEQRLFRDALRAFCRREVAPRVAAAEAAEAFPREFFLRSPAPLGNPKEPLVAASVGDSARPRSPI